MNYGNIQSMREKEAQWRQPIIILCHIIMGVVTYNTNVDTITFFIVFRFLTCLLHYIIRLLQVCVILLTQEHQREHRW